MSGVTSEETVSTALTLCQTSPLSPPCKEFFQNTQRNLQKYSLEWNNSRNHSNQKGRPRYVFEQGQGKKWPCIWSNVFQGVVYQSFVIWKINHRDAPSTASLLKCLQQPELCLEKSRSLKLSLSSHRLPGTHVPTCCKTSRATFQAVCQQEAVIGSRVSLKPRLSNRGF